MEFIYYLAYNETFAHELLVKYLKDQGKILFSA